MELILIRHGKAEERGDPSLDAKRALTPEGRKKLLKSMPGLRSFIEKTDRMLIWSSRLDRAAQTADVLAGIFGTPVIDYHEFISEGVFTDMLEALAAVKPSDTVLVVGHEPYLGLWSQQLCGLTLPFKKGAAAGFSISGLNPPEAELIWFAQPQTLTRMNRDSR